MAAAFCPACCWWAAPLNRDPQGRERSCPSCRSLERHRFLALLLPALAATSEREHPVMLDVAPSPATNPLLDRLWPAGHLRMDFDPAADGRPVDVRASMTDLPLADASVDLVLSSHVLEHIPDDRAAMRETARVLHPDGVGVLTFPSRGGVTEEDFTAGPDERLRRFGQADHVRYYGEDVTDRIATQGLSPVIVTPRDVLDPDTTTTLALDPGERFWLVQPETATRKLPIFDDLRLAMTREFHRALGVNGARGRDLRVEHRRCEKQVPVLERDLKASRAEAAKLARQLTQLRSHPLYRAARRAKHLVRR